VLNAVERLAGGYAFEATRTKQDLEIAETQLRDFQGRIGKPFAHDAYLKELSGLRDQLRAGLSGRDAPVPELAGKIKALRAGNMVEAVERVVKRQSAEDLAPYR
jgi:hypothetical protein